MLTRGSTQTNNPFDSQVILTGAPDQIDALTRWVKANPQGSKINFTDHPLLGEISIEKNLVIRCYDISPDSQMPGRQEIEVWEFIKFLYQCALHLGLFVFADPNFVFRNQQSGSVNGGPAGNAGGEASLEAFIKHWAFKEPDPKSWGINLGEKQTRNFSDFEYGFPRYKGTDINVFILDTYTSDVIEGQGLAAGPVMVTRNRVYGGDYDETTCYHANPWLEKFEQQTILRFRPPAKKQTRRFYSPPQAHIVKEHGVFVAGLVDRVAPEADIQLIEALDEKGHGDLFTLIEALHELFENHPNGPYVINLSLMAVFSRDNMQAVGLNEELEELLEKNPHPIVLTDLLTGLTRHGHLIAPLRLVIQRLVHNGVVVVAAAGNNSKAKENKNHKQAEFPAAYPEVIAVGATDKEGLKTSYTHIGNVYAPGGTTGDNGDLNDWSACTSQTDCRNIGLISVVPKKQHASGFGYWRGTSFSAAMVSGLAALILQKYKAIKGQYPTPAQVQELIENHASVNSCGDRIINVTATLNAIQ